VNSLTTKNQERKKTGKTKKKTFSGDTRLGTLVLLEKKEGQIRTVLLRIGDFIRKMKRMVAGQAEEKKREVGKNMVNPQWNDQEWGGKCVPLAADKIGEKVINFPTVISWRKKTTPSWETRKKTQERNNEKKKRSEGTSKEWEGRSHASIKIKKVKLFSWRRLRLHKNQKKRGGF